MEKLNAIAVLSALAQPTRLKVFIALCRDTPGGATAGDLAAKTETPANTMSAHLAILTRSGILRATRTGRHITYRIASEGVGELLVFLIADCCGSDPDKARAAVMSALADTPLSEPRND